MINAQLSRGQRHQILSDFEDALTRGRAEGMADCAARGRAEAELEAKITLLLGLLGNVVTSGLSSKELATLCGLSVDEVDKLRGK